MCFYKWWFKGKYFCFVLFLVLAAGRERLNDASRCFWDARRTRGFRAAARGRCSSAQAPAKRAERPAPSAKGCRLLEKSLNVLTDHLQKWQRWFLFFFFFFLFPSCVLNVVKARFWCLAEQPHHNLSMKQEHYSSLFPWPVKHLRMNGHCCCFAYYNAKSALVSSLQMVISFKHF